MSSAPGATVPLPSEMGGPLESSLTHLVDKSSAQQGGEADQLAPSEKRADAIHSHGGSSKSWIKKFFPSEETLDKLFSLEHMGNFVVDRQTGRKNFESMPLYVRVGMHLLFVDGNQYMASASVESLLENQSVKQGKIYDETGENVKPHIEAFIKSYELPMDELLVKDLDQYPTFNSFFSRRLLPTARPITSPEDPTVITSPADCRMTVFNTVDQAKQFWIKGKQFTIPILLVGTDTKDDTFKAIQEDGACALAIARLAPQDYHRFHSPVEGEVIAIKDIKGRLALFSARGAHIPSQASYTASLLPASAVNPQAINEDLNVFTLNKRSVMLIHAKLGPNKTTIPIAFVAIGAMLVGSIGWSKKPGDKVVKGEELGWFQYGGSTTICVFPSAAGVAFDQDMATSSEHSMETLVKVGMEIARVK